MTIPDTRPADLSLPCAHPFIGCPCRQPGDATGPVVAKGEYLWGFADWAAKDSALLGVPLESEGSGIPGFSQQRTSRGLLTAANLIGTHWTLCFYELSSQARYVFDSGQSVRIG